MPLLQLTTGVADEIGRVVSISAQISFDELRSAGEN